jgi:outer membrane lipoprotein SlyB
MKKITWAVTFVLFVSFSFISPGCSNPRVRRDAIGTTIGAAVGAGIGAAVDKNKRGRGAAIGAVIGGLAGLSIAELTKKATLDAAETGKKVKYEDGQGNVVVATPKGVDQKTKCKKIMNRTFKDGKVIAESMDEVCEGEKESEEY